MKFSKHQTLMVVLFSESKKIKLKPIIIKADIAKFCLQNAAEAGPRGSTSALRHCSTKNSPTGTFTHFTRTVQYVFVPPLLKAFTKYSDFRLAI